MRSFMLAVLVLALAGGVLVGCGLTDEQRNRVAEIARQNEELTVRLTDVYAQMKAGTLTPQEGAQALLDIKGKVEANVAEIKRIQSEGAGTLGIVSAVIGVFGRSALHGAAKILPSAGPWGALLQGLLTLVLGGSETKKKPPVEEPAKT